MTYFEKLHEGFKSLIELSEEEVVNWILKRPLPQDSFDLFELITGVRPEKTACDLNPSDDDCDSDEDCPGCVKRWLRSEIDS